MNAEVVLRYSTAYPFRLRGNMLRCVYCCDEYQDPTEYRQHMDESHQTFTVSTAFSHCAKSLEYLKVDCTDLSCRVCGIPCDTLEEIARHIRDCHDNNVIDINYEIGMQPHRIDSDKLLCFICDKKFPSINKLCRHTTSHYQKYTCDVCGRSYLTKEALVYHVRCSHTGSHACRKCWREFSTLEEKKNHMRVSKTCWSFCCVTCGERFLSWEFKQKHLVEAHGRPKRTYSCPDCSKVFESRKKYYLHFTLKHTDDIFVCACCGLKFANQGMLDDHLLVHSNEKKFECKICLKSFTRKKSLTQHMWIHSETKRFQCVICEKQFAQKVSLKGHMKTHHPEVPIDF